MATFKTRLSRALSAEKDEEGDMPGFGNCRIRGFGNLDSVCVGVCGVGVCVGGWRWCPNSGPWEAGAPFQFK